MRGSNEAAADGERVPLLRSEEPYSLTDLEQVKREAAQLEVLEDYVYVENDNMPGLVVFKNLVGALSHIAVVLGAYFFLQAAGHEFTPHCSEFRRADVPRTSYKNWQEHLCFASTFCFWTYPIVCPMAVILLFWKNLLDKRLYYECLLNRIFLLQSSSSYLTSPMFWFLFLYFALGMSSIYFHHNEDNRAYHDILYGLLAYLAPLLGFVIFLLGQWSVNRLVVPVPVFLERDYKAAMRLVDNCRFIKDCDFLKCFRVAEDHIHRLSKLHGEEITLSTPEMMGLIQDVLDKWREPQDKSCCGWLQTACGMFYDNYVGPYWVGRFLFYRALQDTRALRFRVWSRVYYFFIWVASFIFIYAMVYSWHELSHIQHTLDDNLVVPAPHEVPEAIGDGIDKLAQHTLLRRR